MNRIIWFTGHSKSGKTTLARELEKSFPCIVLDGNEMRESISLGAGFSKKDRREHNLRVARLAKILSKQTNVVVSVIAPIKKVRREIDKICSPIWIYVKRKLPKRKGHFYEESEKYFTIDTDKLSIKENTEKIKEHLKINKKYSLFIGRWQPLHNGHLTLFDKIRKEGKNILIAIRATNINENNPFSVQERIKMIKEKVPDAETIVIPDIREIVYGRKVGYNIREVRLNKKLENISATKIRKKLGRK